MAEVHIWIDSDVIMMNHDDAVAGDHVTCKRFLNMH